MGGALRPRGRSFLMSEPRATLHDDGCLGFGKDQITVTKSHLHSVRKVTKHICRNCGFVVKKVTIIIENRECNECFPSEHNVVADSYDGGPLPWE